MIFFLIDEYRRVQLTRRYEACTEARTWECDLKCRDCAIPIGADISTEREFSVSTSCRYNVYPTSFGCFNTCFVASLTSHAEWAPPYYEKQKRFVWPSPIRTYRTDCERALYVIERYVQLCRIGLFDSNIKSQ